MKSPQSLWLKAVAVAAANIKPHGIGSEIPGNALPTFPGHFPSLKRETLVHQREEESHGKTVSADSGSNPGGGNPGGDHPGL
jgi:hypothetical protein